MLGVQAIQSVLAVYERSLYLSIMFASPKHTTAVVPGLLDDLYPKVLSLTPQSTHNSVNFTCYRHISLLVAFVNHLVTQYPSQSLYHQQRASVPNDWLPEASRTWLQSLTRMLRSGNYYQLSNLADQKHILQLAQSPTDTDSPVGESPIQLHATLAIRALTMSIDALRSKARTSMWTIIRSAYRELWLEEPYDTGRWLILGSRTR